MGINSEKELSLVRGRLCLVSRCTRNVSTVSVIDCLGRHVGTRYLTEKPTEKRVDRAVLSVLQTGATY